MIAKSADNSPRLMLMVRLRWHFALLAACTLSSTDLCSARADPPASEARGPGETVANEVGPEAVVRYLLEHEKPNGAFGPLGHDHTDLAWNYPAVHALTLLDAAVPRPEDCFRNGRGAIYKQPGTHNPNRAWDVYQRAQLAAVLGREFDDGLDLKGSWMLQHKDREGNYYFGIPDAKLRSRVALFCDIPTLSYFVEAITSSGGQIENPEIAGNFLRSRQVDSGAFVDAYRSENAVQSDAHLLVTAQAVLALHSLGLKVPRGKACAEWLRACQEEAGGFRWSPSNSAPSNRADVWYTWAAARALHVLDTQPADVSGCLTWINSLQHPDGGFGDRPGWNSRLYSTYYAVHALEVLTGDARAAIHNKKASVWRRTIPEGEYSIYQAHLKSPPGGSEMVETAVEMGFHFLGVKENSPDTRPVSVATARAHAIEKGYPLEMVSCPEQYAHTLKWLGGHPANHVANYIIPPGLSDQQKNRFHAADSAGRKGLAWPDYAKQVIAPVVATESLFYPEMDYGMMNAYMVYDDGLAGGPGYNAVIGALGWPNWDWIRFFPYRERWVGKLPVVVDGDAHGDIQDWRERLERQRMLYIARKHDLPSFLRACREGRTVCVIRGGADRSEIAFYGDPVAVDYVKQHRQQWQWWTDAAGR